MFKARSTDGLIGMSKPVTLKCNFRGPQLSIYREAPTILERMKTLILGWASRLWANPCSDPDRKDIPTTQTFGPAYCTILWVRQAASNSAARL